MAETGKRMKSMLAVDVRRNVHNAAVFILWPGSVLSCRF